MKYIVTIERENDIGEVSTEKIEVETKSAGLAANMAENISVGSKSISIHTTQEIEGRCSRCNMFIFEDDKFQRRGGKLVCEAC